MNENSENRLPTGLILLLIYQGILVLSLGPLAVWLEWGLWPFPVLAGCGVAMIFASVEMARRSPRGFLLGMICHLLLAIPALLFVLFCAYWGVSGLLRQDAWAPLTLILGLMWLPFVVISGWAFFYLRRLRKSLFPCNVNSEGPATDPWRQAPKQEAR